MKSLLYTFILIFISLPLALLAAPDASELNQRGVEALNDGRLEEAEDLFRQAHKIAPEEQTILDNLVVAYNAQALFEIKQGRIEQARKHFKQALEIDPDDQQTHNNYFSAVNNFAVSLTQQKRYTEAEPVFLEMKKLEPYVNDDDLLQTSRHNHVSMLVMWGMDELDAGGSIRGRNLLYRAIDMDQENATALRALADHFYNYDLYSLAREYYEKAMAADPLRKRQDKERIEQCLADMEFERNAEQMTDERHRFQVSYDAWISERKIHLLIAVMTEAYEHLSVEIGHKPRPPLRVKVYDSDDFYEIHGLPHWAGGFFDGKLRLPSHLLNLDEKAIRRVVYHEMTHVFLSSWLGDKLEFWMHEGLAQHFEPDWRLNPQELAHLVNVVKYSSFKFEEIRLREFETFSERSRAQEAYAHAKGFMHYIIETRPEGSLGEFLKLIAEGKTTDQACKQAFGAMLEDLHVEWRMWGRAKYPKIYDDTLREKINDRASIGHSDNFN
ncbi:tetratricopeptide repeat protein [Candidatus Sumerlaeota bacterium]|nr:tetratricopeptide repeat protein [Candidatus Sumerlaeota bacterium]